MMPVVLSMKAKKAYMAAGGAAVAYVSAVVATSGLQALVGEPAGWWLAGLSLVVGTFVTTYNSPNAADEIAEAAPAAAPLPAPAAAPVPAPAVTVAPKPAAPLTFITAPATAPFTVSTSAAPFVPAPDAGEASPATVVDPTAVASLHLDPNSR